jgi:DNA-binding HxlR family transcriptional regulator
MPEEPAPYGSVEPAVAPEAAPAEAAEAPKAGAPAAEAPTPLAAALDHVGDRWSLLVVETLLDGPRRFGEIGSALPGIAPNILTDRLRRLERSGIVRATPYSTRPPRMAYALTADGRELAGALRLLADWGARHTADADAIRHAACGTALEARWWCPTCARAVEGAEADELSSL